MLSFKHKNNQINKKITHHLQMVFPKPVKKLQLITLSLGFVKLCNS